MNEDLFRNNDLIHCYADRVFIIMFDSGLLNGEIRRFGFCISPFDDPIEAILQAQKDGWDYVEVYWEPPIVSVDESSLRRIRDAVELSGTPIILHANSMLTGFSPYSNVRKAYIQEMQQCFRFANETGTSIVGIHVDGINRLRRKLHGNKAIIDKCYREWKLMIRQLIDTACSYNIQLVGENGPNSNNEVLNQIFKDLPELELLLDIGHTNLRISNFSFEHFIREMPKRVGHIHIHDNKGIYDEHLPVGYGTINWENIVQ